jgi:tetratricopeptide (TPR) repeat protein
MHTSRLITWFAGVSAVSALLGACSNSQSRAANYMAHGKAYLAEANYEKARVEFRNAAQIDPTGAEAQYYLGQVAEKVGDGRTAVRQYRSAIAAQPGFALARAALGRLFLYGGRADKAKELVETGLTIDPQNAPLLTVRGAARAQLGDLQGGLQDAQTAVQLEPDDSYAIALVASLYQQQAKYDQAVAAVQLGLQRLPGNVELRSILADLYLAEQQPAQAEEQLRQIVALEPGNSDHRYLLARFYVQQGQVDAAERTLRDAVAALPGEVHVKLQLAEFLAVQRGAEAASVQAQQFLAADPQNDELKLVLGEFLAQDGKVAAAEQALRAVIAHAGVRVDGLAARVRLAALLAARKDWVSASALIAEVLAQNPRDNDALMIGANIALSQGNAQSAIEDLRAVLRDRPDAIPVMRMLAMAYRQNQQPELAEKTLRDALQLSPQDFACRLELAQSLITVSKFDEAEALLAQLARDYPASMPARESLFRAQAGLGHYTDAHASAESIERLSPQQGLGYYLAGLIDETQGKADSAARNYRQALQREPESGESLAALVRLELKSGQSAAAMALVDGAIARTPESAVPRNLKGELLLGRGQTDAAIAAFQEAVRIAPTWPQGYRSLALAQRSAKQDEGAIRTLQEGIRITGADALMTDLGQFYEQLGRIDDAIALYQGILSNNPSSSLAANSLAMLLVNYRGDSASLAQAQKLADQLTASSEVSTIDTRGWVKFKSGDFHGAESLLQQAVDRSPAAPMLRYHLGMAQLRSGEQQAARRNLEAAVKSEQPFAGKDEARAALTQLKRTTSVG